MIWLYLLTQFEKKHYIYTTGLLGGETFFNSIEIDLFRWASGLFGSVSMIWVAGIFFKKIEKTSLSLYIENMGEESLAMYALSVSLLSFWLPRIMNHVLTIFHINISKYILAYDLLFTPAVAFAYSAALLAIIRWFRKKGVYKLLFGK